MATREHIAGRPDARRERPGAPRTTAVRPPSGRSRRVWPILLTLVLLAGVLVIGQMPEAAGPIQRLRAFLEFYVGVFCLLSATAAVVAGVVAAQRNLPIRLRILFQGAHRATALMAVGFLVSHIMLKVMEAHASVLDAVIPFGGHRGGYVAMGTVAGDLLIIILATGIVRGRFVSRPKPWMWRAVHASAYVMWPMAIAHGLLAGRPPLGAWVTISYIVCMIFVAIAATGRLPRLVRDRRMLSGRKVKGDDRMPADPPRASRGGSSSGSSGDGADIPDEEFWRQLRAETAPWIGDRR